MNKYCRASVGIVCAFGVFGSVPLQAADETTVTVYASRIDDAKEELPTHVQVFGRQDASDALCATFPDLLKKKAGIDVWQLNSNPMQSEIAMRGFGENSFGRVKVFLDGEELGNVDMFAPNLMRIPLSCIERVEILHGPSAVLYGDGAVAGVVNITTDTRDYTKKTRLAGKAGTQDTYGGSFSTKGGFEAEGIQYSAAYDYLQSGGYRRRSAYRLHTASAALRKNFANGSSFAVKSAYQNSFYELPGALTREQLGRSRKAAYNDSDWAKAWNGAISGEMKAKLADDQWLHLDAGFNRQRRLANWGAQRYRNRYDLFGLFVSPRYVNECDIGDFANKFTIGLDARYDRDEITDNSGYNNRKYHFGRIRAAVFAQDEFHITEELSVIAGARLERISSRWSHYRGLADTSRTDWMGDYELALAYRPMETLKTWIKGARFHRSAFCDEMNYTSNGRLLKPESGTSLDAGVEWGFLDDFTFDFDAYAMLMDDEIFYNPHAKYSPYGSWGGYNCNSPSRTRRAGFDTGLAWKRERVAEASVRYGFVHADFASGQYHGNDIPRVPRQRIRAEAGVWVLGALELKGGVRYVSAQRLAGDFENSHSRLHGFTVFDIGLHFDAPWGWAKGWKASFVIDNLFDRKYCDFAGWSDYSGAYYYPACGRSAMFTLAYEF